MALIRLVVALLGLQSYIFGFTFCQNSCKASIVRSGLTSVVTIVDSVPVSFTCESAYGRRNFNVFRDGYRQYLCNNNEDNDILSDVTIFWEINGAGKYISTDDLPSEYIQQGIAISSDCTHFNYTELSNACSMLLGDDNDECDDSECRERLIMSLLPYCWTNITVPAKAANNNTEYCCGTHTVACPNRIYWNVYGPGRIQVQGLLAAPPSLQLSKYIYNDSSLLISWNAPFTLPQIPISFYQVKINNMVDLMIENISSNANDQVMLDVNSTSLDIDTIGTFRFIYSPSCESVEFCVSAWNDVGEGESGTLLFSQASLQDVIIYVPDDIQDAICILCVFSDDSQATGCHVRFKQTQQLMENATTTTMEFNLTRKLTGLESMIAPNIINLKLDAFNCITVETSGNYTVFVREIECTGGIGNIEFVRSAIISSFESTYRPNVIFNTMYTITGGSGVAIKVLAASTVLLTVTGTLLLILVLVLACILSNKRSERAPNAVHSSKRKDLDLQLQLNAVHHVQSSGTSALASGSTSSPIYETIRDYDKDIATNRHSHTSSPAHGAGDTKKGWDSSVSELKPCVAYNVFHKD